MSPTGEGGEGGGEGRGGVGRGRKGKGRGGKVMGMGRRGGIGESVMLPNYTETIILKRWRHLKHINSVKCVHVTKCGQRMNSLSRQQWGGVGVSAPPSTHLQVGTP